GDGILPLAGTYACDALAGFAPHGGLWASVSGAVQEFYGGGGRASADVVPICRAESAGGENGEAGGTVAVGQPVGESEGNRRTKVDSVAVAGGSSAAVGGMREPSAE